MKYELKASEDGLSASASVGCILRQLEAKWLANGGGAVDTLMIPVGGDGRKTGATLNSVLWAIKVFAVDAEKKLVEGFPHPTSQEGIFPVLISRCGEELEELQQSAGRHYVNIGGRGENIIWGQKGGCYALRAVVMPYIFLRLV